MPSVPESSTPSTPTISEMRRPYRIAENTSRPCSSVPSRNGVWPSAVHSGAMREFINCSCAGSNGFCTASREANIASRKKSAVMPAATMVRRERRNEYNRSLSTARPSQPARRKPVGGAAGSTLCWTTASDMRISRSGRALEGRAQPRIDHGVEDIDHQVDGDEDQRDHQQVGRHDRNIDILHRLHEQQSHPRPLEDGFSDDCKCNNRAKLQAGHGDDGN